MSLEVDQLQPPQRSPREKLFRLSSEDEPRGGGGGGGGAGGGNGGESRPESPLLLTRDKSAATLLRVSTQSSALNTNVGRQDSSRFRPGPARKLRRRAVLKSGECNVLQSRISRRSLRFLQDIFTTLVDTQWRWTLLCFALSFLLSWLVFAGLWWLIAFTHGDFEERHMRDEHWRPCVVELHSFASCFLFSIETQHTIGYGGRATTEECPEAIFVMCIQSISGVMIQAFMVGIVFAKMSRPKQRTQTLLFSRNAVICQRDGLLCLMFRVGDMRKSHIIGATVRAQLIRSRQSKEGELLAHSQHELRVGADGQAESSLFFIWPCSVVHKIDADSPLYNWSAEDMLAERFEIVVILEGTIESTGQTTQARSSYLPQELLWGHRFEPVVSYSKERQGYEVDYSLFDSTQQVDTPLCSGRELAEFYRLQDELRRQQQQHHQQQQSTSPYSTTAPGFPMDEELMVATTPSHLSDSRQYLRAYSEGSGPPPYGCGSNRPADPEDGSSSIATSAAVAPQSPVLQFSMARYFLQATRSSSLRSLDGSRTFLAKRSPLHLQAGGIMQQQLLQQQQHSSSFSTLPNAPRSRLQSGGEQQQQQLNYNNNNNNNSGGAESTTTPSTPLLVSTRYRRSYRHAQLKDVVSRLDPAKIAAARAAADNDDNSSSGSSSESEGPTNPPTPVVKKRPKPNLRLDLPPLQSAAFTDV